MTTNSNPSFPEPIAIIGAGCRFPGSSNSPSKLWDLLRKPVDVVSRIPLDRFNVDRFYHPDGSHHGTTNVQNAYFISEDVRHFDAQFFGVPPNEADAIDPQQRVLLETVYEAMEAAGATIEKLQGSDTAVYVGLMSTDYQAMQGKDFDYLHPYCATGTAASNASSRISYYFDWHGPSLTVDTACSSSLVSVHHAVQALRSGTSKVAVAAGTNLQLYPLPFVSQSKLNMLSPTGRSRMWDVKADGYARGEGVAAVLLKTLSQAIADGDHIECIIRETGVNQDGKTKGITMPSAIAQAALIKDTYRRAGLDLTKPSDRPQYFEAHGTGTPAGDPQEAEALSLAFFDGQARDADDVLYVGSVKTVIGHTEGTAGLAGILKAALALKHGILPSNLLFDELSPSVQPFYDHLQILRSPKEWPLTPEGIPRRASVNSFGFGGTNAHAILESYSNVSSQIVEEPAMLAQLTPSLPFVFSASSEKTLKAQVTSHLQYLQANTVNIHDLAYTLSCRRSTLPVKIALAATTVESLIEKMTSALQQAESETSFGQRTLSNTTAILGVFTGQGAQWPEMGAKLISTSCVARELIRELDLSLASLPEGDRPSWRIHEELATSASTSRIGEAALSQPLCTAVQVLIVQLLQKAGIRFKAVVGHSSGEITAAFAAGYISAHDAIRIAYYRGLYAKQAAGLDGQQGAMMAVGTSIEDAQELCMTEDFEGRLCVAASNSVSSVTLSGDADAIAEAKAVFEEEKKFARLLKVDTAYHSHHMQRCAEAYASALQSCKIRISTPVENAPTWFSTVHGGRQMTAVDTLTSTYWIENMTQTVLFSQGLETACNAISFSFVLEVGPHPALAGPAKQTINDVSKYDVPYFGVLKRGNNDVEAFTEALGAVWSHHGSGTVNFTELLKQHSDGHQLRPLTDLPTYAWNHDRDFWTEARLTKLFRTQPGTFHELLGMHEADGTDEQWRWKNVLKPKEIPWLTDHKLQGQVVFPGTGYIALAMEASMKVASGRQVKLIDLCDLQIQKAIAIDATSGTEIVVTMTDVHEDQASQTISADFTSYSAISRDSVKLQVNACGSVLIHLGEADSQILASRGPLPSGLSKVDINQFYSAMDELGYGYDGSFRRMLSLQRRLGVSSGTIAHPSHDSEHALLFHPGMLDTSLQGLFAAFSAPGDGGLWSIHVPTGIRRVSLVPSLCGRYMPEEVAFDCAVTGLERNSITGDVDVFVPATGCRMIQIDGLGLVPFTAATRADDRHLFSESVWGPASPDGELVLGDRKAPDELTKKAMDCERVAFYYFRTLNETIDEAERKVLQLPPHQLALFENAAHICEQVSQNAHPYAKQEWVQDSRATVSDIINSYGDDADFNIMRAVGEALPAVVRGTTTILEHMTKDGRLDHYYKDALGFEVANELSAAMMQQLAFRYPHMNILEVGAGTGGSTRGILNALGTAFRTYTYTDISSGFFEKAQEKFKAFAGRIIFKTLNIEKDPIEQGFVGGAYDVVVAANVLHATKPLEQTLLNVRRLLKPGGFLVLLEIVDNGPMRIGLVMGGLPGWWVGRDDGRQFAPTITLPEWDTLLQKTGFSGVDTFTPLRTPLPWPTSVFISQAINDEVMLLRQPMLWTPNDTTIGELILVGGETKITADLAENIESAIGSRYQQVIRASCLEALADVKIPPGCTVISLSDIDKPVFENITETGFEQLKSLFLTAKNVLWITRDYRCENSCAALIVGFCRSVTTELPELRLQLVDIDEVQSSHANLFAQLLLRLNLTDQWEKTGSHNGLLWTTEPELIVESNQISVLRSKPQTAQNDRYNSIKRPIYKTVDLNTTAARLEWDEFSHYQLLEEYRTRSSALEHQINVEVECSLLSSIRTSAGYFFLSLGNDSSTGDKVLSLAMQNSSMITIPRSWSVPVDAARSIDAPYLSIILGYLCSQRIQSMMPSGGTLLIHEPDAFVASLLSRQLTEQGVRVFFTTSKSSSKKRNWINIHHRAPKRVIDSLLPKGTSLFLDLSPDFTSTESLGRRISQSLPNHCERLDATALLGLDGFHIPGKHDVEIENLLMKANEFAMAILSAVPEGMPLRLVPVKQILDRPEKAEPLSIVDWRGSRSLPILVESIENRSDLLKADRTYWLLGLAGDLGQSLVDWMIAHGARFIVISSRNPKVPSEWLEQCRRKGAVVECVPCDVTSFDDLQRGRDLIASQYPTIAGVANGALILRDKAFATMDLDSFKAVCKPKVNGTAYLDQLFDTDTLDFFIPFSSIVATTGNLGQSAYSAANNYMKTIVAQRRRRGLAGSVIDISRVLGVGYVERESKVAGRLTEKIVERMMNVAMAMSESDLHQLFAEAILAGRPGSTEKVDIVTGIRTLTSDATSNVLWAANVKFSHFIRDLGEIAVVAGDDDAANRVPIKAQIAEAQSLEEVFEIFKNSLSAKLKTALQLAKDEEVRDTMPIIDLGVDSLVAVEIRSWFMQETGGIDLPVLKILGGANVMDLADDAMEKLPASVFDKLDGPKEADETDTGTSSDKEGSPSTPSLRGESTSSETDVEEVIMADLKQ